jgi:CheY-specific phosphatase CheX
MSEHQLGSALPERFDFYHLGPVALRDRSTGATTAASLEDLLAGCATVGFSIQGDIQGMLIVAFEKDLDFSTYTELGNVVASQLVTQLNRRDGIDVMISPPRPLTAERLAKILPALRAPSTVVRTYLHRTGEKAEIPIHVLISGLGGETLENV